MVFLHFLSLVFLTLVHGQVRLSPKGILNNLTPQPLPSVNQIQEADPLGNRFWREDVKGAMRLSYGMQIHDTCLKQAKALGLNDDELKARLEKFFGLTYRDIKNCSERYPELQKYYFNDWISQSRREVVLCSLKDQFDAGKSGSAINQSTHLDHLILKGDLDKNVELKVDASRHQPAFMFAKNNWEHLLITVLPIEEEKTLLIHEILHSTGANNRGDHNLIERISSRKTNSCDDNTLIDRVKTISEICTGSPVNKDSLFAEEETALQLLALRMSECGNDRGCTNVFTSLGQSDSFDVGVKSLDMTDLDAQKLCTRIKDDGACITKINSKLFQNPELKVLTEFLEKRLAKVLPKLGSELNKPLLALSPSMMVIADRVSNSEENCLNILFSKNQAGSLLLNPLVIEHAENPQLGLAFQFSENTKTLLRSHIDSWDAALLSLENSAYWPKPCKDQKENIHQSLTELRKNTTELENEGYLELIVDFASNKKTINSGASSHLGKPSLTDQLLGKSITKLYIRIAKKWDPELIDCSYKKLFKNISKSKDIHTLKTLLQAEENMLDPSY